MNPFSVAKEGEQFLLTPPVHAVVDSFGADDGFMAGLLYSFLEGSSFRKVLTLRWHVQHCHVPAPASITQHFPLITRNIC